MEEVDLSAFDVSSGADTGAKLELLDKHGKKSGEWIHLLGSDSKEYQSKVSEHNTQRLRTMVSRQMRIAAEEVEQQSIDRLVVCTKDWSFKAKNGEKLPCTPANIERVYRASILIREQVEGFIFDRQNFTTA